MGRAAMPSHRDCANCGAFEGSIPGCRNHIACCRCNLAFYCSTKCQHHHWQGKHWETCKTLEERLVQFVDASEEEKEATGTCLDVKCAICLESLSRHDDEASTLTTLACSHRGFHASCVKELQEGGVRNACPLCRKKQPPSLEKTFDDACALFIYVKKRAEQTPNGPWRTLKRGELEKAHRAMRLWEEAASQGHAHAQYNLGFMRENDHVAVRSYSEAAAWYEKAADQGHARSQFSLGVLLQHGLGVNQNFFEAKDYFEKAAEQGEARAQFNLGLMYKNGEGVKQSSIEAAEWWEKAAELGHAKAQNNLGVMYEFGQGVPQSYSKAKKLFEKAAKQNHSSAQYNLGVMYEKGYGVEQSDSKAKKWWKKAVEQQGVRVEAGRLKAQ